MHFRLLTRGECVSVNLCDSMQGNTVEGLVWADYKRPAKLKLRLNNFNETFPDQWKEVYS